LTGLLALYVARSASFGTTYGPLTGIVALLLWANLSSVALFLGVAFAAQLEAVRAGAPAPALADPVMAAERSGVAAAPSALSPDLKPTEACTRAPHGL